MVTGDDVIKKFIEYITADWTKEDWQATSFSELDYHVNMWLAENDRASLNDFFLAKFDFEEYMGW